MPNEITYKKYTNIEIDKLEEERIENLNKQLAAWVEKQKNVVKEKDAEGFNITKNIDMDKIRDEEEKNKNAKLEELRFQFDKEKNESIDSLKNEIDNFAKEFGKKRKQAYDIQLNKKINEIDAKYKDRLEELKKENDELIANEPKKPDYPELLNSSEDIKKYLDIQKDIEKLEALYRNNYLEANTIKNLQGSWITKKNALLVDIDNANYIESKKNGKSKQKAKADKLVKEVERTNEEIRKYADQIAKYEVELTNGMNKIDALNKELEPLKAKYNTIKEKYGKDPEIAEEETKQQYKLQLDDYDKRKSEFENSKKNMADKISGLNNTIKIEKEEAEKSISIQVNKEYGFDAEQKGKEQLKQQLTQLVAKQPDVEAIQKIKYECEENIKNRINKQKEEIEKKYTETNAVKLNMIESKSKIIEDRVKKGIDLYREIEILQSTHKSGADSEEFQNMINALRTCADAFTDVKVQGKEVNKDAMPKEVEMKCQNALLMCKNYIEKKNSRTIKYFSDAATNRIDKTKIIMCDLCLICPSIRHNKDLTDEVLQQRKNQLLKKNHVAGNTVKQPAVEKQSVNMNHSI